MNDNDAPPKTLTEVGLIGDDTWRKLKQEVQEFQRFKYHPSMSRPKK
jgi:hypothetical protein